MAVKKRWTVHERIFVVLLVIVLLLVSLVVAKAQGLLIPEQPSIDVVDGVVELDSMTLEQKIAQMVVVHGGLHNREAWKKMQLGGIHLFALENEALYRDIIATFQHQMQIPFLVTVDFEGCLNPFSNFKETEPLSEVDSIGEAFQKGSEDAAYLKNIGFSVNFAPVVDLDDQIWNCRSFPGDARTISELAEAYILGVQSQGVIATAKHYPGKTLVVKDPHKFLVAATIDEEDVHPYDYLFGKDVVDSVMVSHIITSGEINSGGVPAVSSENVVGKVKDEFSGLVISDEINMMGLKNFYDTLDEMYLAVFTAGNDIILNFNEDPNEVYRMITIVKEAVQRGDIAEERIDASVKKILEAKGFVVE